MVNGSHWRYEVPMTIDLLLAWVLFVAAFLVAACEATDGE